MTDLKFAFRQLLKNPGFTAVVVLTVARGVMSRKSVIENRSSTLRSGHAVQTGTFRHATEDGSNPDQT